MTPEQPPSSSRPARPGVDARRQALGLDAPATRARESLADSLARIPDLRPDDELLLAGAPAGVASSASVVTSPADAGPAAKAVPAEPEPALVGGGAAASAEVAGAGAAVVARSAEDQLQVAFTAPTAAPTAADAGPATSSDATPPGAGDPTATAGSGRSKPPMWRRVTFAVVLVGLVASIPVLGYAGYQLISDSHDGNFSGEAQVPTDPGYEAPVDPTPTAVAVQYDDAGQPNGLTFLTLGGAEGGGAVVFVPLDTQVAAPSMGVNKLRQTYSYFADRPSVAREQLAGQTGKLLNVGIDEIIDLGTAGWSQLVDPVAPLQIDNPYPVPLGFGVTIPEGPTSLTADQVGLYLATKAPNETDIQRLERQQLVWQAWLKQVAASGNPDAVPGESTAGIGKFAKALAKGPVSYSVLPVTIADDIPNTYRIDKSEVNDLITNIVAAPTAAVPGSRFTVRMLNGVSPDAIPSDIVRQVVGRGGAVTVLGNGPQFGTGKTEIVYSNPAKKDLANLIATSMGATGKVRLDREAPDTVDLTIVLGKDILGEASGEGSPGATTPGSTGGN